MRWQIFYGDDTEYRDSDGPPELAPTRNVQAIVSEDPDTGRRIERQVDFYVWHASRGWVGVDRFGLYDYLIEPGWKIVLFGRTLSYREYSRLLDRASKSDYLPPKSAHLPEERS